MWLKSKRTTYLGHLKFAIFVGNIISYDNLFAYKCTSLSIINIKRQQNMSIKSRHKMNLNRQEGSVVRKAFLAQC